MWIELLKDMLGQKAGQRIDVDDADARALIGASAARACDSDPLPALITRSLGTAMESLTASLNEAVDNALKAFADAQAKSLRTQRPLLFGPGGDGDPRRPTFGKFLLAIRLGDRKALETMGSYPVDGQGIEQKAALNLATGSQGGYTVPEMFHAELMAVAEEMGIVEKRCTRIPMGSTTVKIPVLDVTTAPSAGDTAFFGGLAAAWTEEAAAITEDEPTFKEITLTAHKLAGYTLASSELLADNAIGLEALLRNLFGGYIAWYKDHAFLRGNGVGKPLGILTSNAFLALTRSGASAFALADAAKMYSRLMPGWQRRSTAWVMHTTVFEKALQLAESGTGSDLMITDRGSDAPRMSLWGIPIEVSEKLPALNTAGDVMLCDFRHYLCGQRGTVEIAFSDHFKFQNDQGAWRFVVRCDGQPWLRSTVTLSDASTTVSPFVGLAAG